MRKELEVLLSSVILPLLSILIPWRYCVRFFWYVAKNNSLHQNQVNASLAVASKYLNISEPESWLHRARFHLLIDQADYFLSCFRTKRWMLRNLAVSDGNVLNNCNSNTLFITFHWGQGFYALNYLKQHGFTASWLHLPAAKQLELGNYVAGFMGRLRIRQVGRLAGAKPIAVQGSIAKMYTRLIENKQAVMAMPDVPLQHGSSFISVQLLGKPAILPAGLIKMAARENIAVCIYTIKIDQTTGLRKLSFSKPVCEQNHQILAQNLADHLTKTIEADSAAWYMWPQADSFFSNHSLPTSP